jgi:hypothetical protein
MNLRFLMAQPATDYYVWQVEVCINNFIKNGINPNNIDVVCWKQNGIIPDNWSKLANNYPVRFFFYDDTRETKHYISSIRPNIIKQHFQRFPELKDEAIFYHDCDIILSKPIDFNQFLNDDKWYGSDCRWYISHDYIIGKGEDILDKMCEIVGIDKEIVKKNELNSIGAQYLMKGIDYHFWNNVEKDCERLFKEISELNDEKVQLDRHTMPEGEARQPYHPLQIWCADMWAVLWNGWKRGKETICHKDLEFSWGTSTEDDFHRLNIMHNAGVTGPNQGLFYKANYMNEFPFDKSEEPNKNTASWWYWNEIQQTAKKSVLINQIPLRNGIYIGK